MSAPLRLCLTLHNHQPIGNFDEVFRQSYEDSYLPFLDVFEPFEHINISLHTSGPLMEWLDQHHGDYLDRLSRLVEAGRIEIVGGAFYEAILPMIPARDRVGQIESYRNWLQQRLGATVRGAWIPERVWEQNLTSDLVRAGVAYTVLDDFHFRSAGVDDAQMNGYFVTEDEGRVLAVFPGNERLRYLIPFHGVQETIDHLRHLHGRNPGATFVFGDDGEKFGAWPQTNRHVYHDGWLRRFFQALTDNRDWISCTTLGTALDSAPAVGKVYLPAASYREMTEWALPSEQQQKYHQLRDELQHSQQWAKVQPFVQGGYWRNFKVKYPETDEMYARMMLVSQRWADLHHQGYRGDQMQYAQRELFRGQCNCPYWHGSFGGVYLPHLRQATYNHLIAADNILDQVENKTPGWVHIEQDDFNLDGSREIQLANQQLFSFINPGQGGQLYELDVRSICHNLLATLTRRPEPYHQQILNATQHDERCKQQGLAGKLQLDAFPRKSLVDHFYPIDTTLDDVSSGVAEEQADFATGAYDAVIRRKPQRVQVQLTREDSVGEHRIRVSKAVSLNADSSALEICYLLENLPAETLHFGVEFNFSGMPAGADDRYFYHGDHLPLGQLGTRLSLAETSDLALVDRWLGLEAQLQISQPSRIWTFPIETVSNSEGGFEAVHQSVAVIPHWFVQPDENGQWSVTLRLNADTSLAASRMAESSVECQTEPVGQ